MGVMDGLKKSWLMVAVALLMLSGCGLHRDFVMPNLPPSNTSFVVDATQPDENPAFLAGEGNVYSCQFAIHHMRRVVTQGLEGKRLAEGFIKQKRGFATETRPAPAKPQSTYSSNRILN